MKRTFLTKRGHFTIKLVDWTSWTIKHVCWTPTGSEVNTIRYGKFVLSLWQSKPISVCLEKGSLPSPIAMFPRQGGSGVVGHCCPGLLAFGKPLLFLVLEVRFLGSQRTAVPKAGRPQLGIQLMYGEITMIELMRQLQAAAKPGIVSLSAWAREVQDAIAWSSFALARQKQTLLDLWRHVEPSASD